MSPVRLSGQDAYFLYRETAGALMHTLKVAVCEPPEPPLGEAALLASVEGHLHLLPPLRRRLVPVPLGFHHPVWIEDPAFDLRAHVRRAALPAPGGARELDAFVGGIASLPLDRTRPLWELWEVGGLAGGRVAYVLKLHHALADGVASAALISHSAARDPDSRPPAPERAWEPEPLPRAWRLLADASRDHLRQLARLPDLVRRSLRGARAARRRRRGAAAPPPALWDAPKLRFNRALGPERIYASATLPLAPLRRVKDALGATVNDVVLALCAGALRRNLVARGELPERALSASVPVSADPGGAALRLAGNRVAYLLTALPTQVADPVLRVRAVREVTAEAKLELELGGRALTFEWMDYLPPLLYTWLRRGHARLRLADSLPPPSNLVVSNVPGPRETLYWSGAKLVELYSIGPLSEGIGLNFTVWSYRDALHVAALACREQVPDLREIVASLGAELAQLEEAAGATDLPG
jgi:diacylglycerol O-acyltransferase